MTERAFNAFSDSARAPVGVSGVPLPGQLRAELEEAFGIDLSRVRLHCGAEADAIARRFDASAVATTAAIFFRSGAYQPSTPDGRELLAHEVFHLVQQASGPVGGHVMAGGVRVSDPADPWECAAAEVGRRFSRGERLGSLVTGSPRAPGWGNEAPDQSVPTVQRWDSFEHRLLGDTPQATLVDMMAYGSPTVRAAAFTEATTLLQYLAQNATNITSASQITAVCPYVRPVQLPGSGLWVTYGEINSLADYLADPTEIATTPVAILLPIIQTMREVSYNLLSYFDAHQLLSWPLNQIIPWTEFPNALHQQWAPGWLHKILESRALDELTTGLGTLGRDHYTGLLARNACHFAPFTWFRWLAWHQLAREQALTAYQSQGQPSYNANVTQAWITHGYADHFLQDAFASGHLVNKTKVMQWFIELAEANTVSIFDWEIGMPIQDWDAIQNLTCAQQPGLAGPQLYTPGFGGPSNDPQTAEEQPNSSTPPVYQLRMNATGIQGPNLATKSQNYMNYLTMLQNLVVQAVTASLHDTFNARELAVATQAGGQGSFTVYGDDMMLNGGTGPGIVSATAQLSQQALAEIITTGETSITAEALQAQFPNYVQSNGSWLSLQEWHAEGGEVYQEVQSLFTSPGTYAKGVGSYGTDLGLVSVDQPEAAAFTPNWGAPVGMGCATALRPAVVSFDNVLYIFYVSVDTGNIAAVATPEGGGGWIPVSLPADLATTAAPAAAVWNGQLYLAYTTATNTIEILASPDGSTWNPATPPPGAGSGQYGVGLTACNGALYVAYAVASSAVEYIWLDNAGWHGPTSIPNSSAYGSPALAAQGDTLIVAFEGSKGSIDWSSVPAGAAPGPAQSIGSDVTQGEVSLATVAGGVLLGYRGKSGGATAKLYTRYLPLGSSKWNSTNQMSGLTGSGPIAVGANNQLQSVSIFPQLGALYWSTYNVSAGSWGSPYSVSLFSGLPPALTTFQGALVAVLQVSWEMYVSTSTNGVSWTVPVQLPAGVGTGYPPAVVAIDGSTLWLAYNDQACINILSYDGTTWTGPTPVTGVGSAIGGVALAEFNGLIYLAYLSGSATSPAIAWQSYDPVSGSWTSLGAIPTTAKPGAPSLTGWGDYLYLGYVDSHSMYTQSYDSVSGTWTEPPQKVGGQTANAMALGAFEDHLVLVWQGTGSSTSLNGMWNNGSGWRGKQTFESTSVGASLVFFRDPDNPSADQDALWICYRGSGNIVGLCRRLLTAPE
jgi:hypothetical protein